MSAIRQSGHALDLGGSRPTGATYNTGLCIPRRLGQKVGMGATRREHEARVPTVLTPPPTTQPERRNTQERNKVAGKRGIDVTFALPPLPRVCGGGRAIKISTSPQLSVPIEGEGGREGRGRRCSARTASAPARLIGAIPLWTLDYRRPPSATDAVITAIKPADHPPVARQTRIFIFRIFRSTHIFTHSCTHLLPSFRSIDVPVHASSD